MRRTRQSGPRGSDRAANPLRARPCPQLALVTGALITAIAVPLIELEGSQPPEKTVLLQHHRFNLTFVLGTVAATTLGLYADRVARDRRGPPGA